MEQYYPVLFRRYALREGSGGAGTQRGGFGLHYEVELLRGEARASFVMDHGRFGPQGVLRRQRRRAPTWCACTAAARRSSRSTCPRTRTSRSRPATACEVRTPGGGGYGDPFARDPALVARDVGRGYYTARAGPRALRRGADGAMRRGRRGATASLRKARSADQSDG